MQIVPDVNVLVSAAVTPEGVCRTLLDALERSPLDLVVSPLLLMEVDRVRRDPGSIPGDPAPWVPRHVSGLALIEADASPDPQPLVEADPGDDYLVRLVLAATDRILVTGDPHLLALAGTYPIVDPRTLLDRILAADRTER